MPVVYDLWHLCGGRRAAGRGHEARRRGFEQGWGRGLKQGAGLADRGRRATTMGQTTLRLQQKTNILYYN